MTHAPEPTRPANGSSPRLDALNWPEVRELLTHDPIVVVPVGATEQHGRHLPLSVDRVLCTAVAERAARAATGRGRPTVVAPTIAVGYSPHHMAFPGSLTLRAATFTAVATDMATSLSEHGFHRILLLNGHGGNANLLRSAAQSLRFEHDVRVSVASYWDFALDRIASWRTSELGGINHACEMETSLMAALHPESVRMDAAEDVLPPRSRFASGDLTETGPVTRAGSFEELTPSGAIGRPTLADPERGRALLDAIVEEVTEYLIEWT